jgi:hypothetical protein
LGPHFYLQEDCLASGVAKQFRSQLDAIRAALFSVSSDMADKPWREGGWTRKEIVGHLLDSAANNRQRFVRAAIDGSYAGPMYAQDAWVAIHGYAELPWKTLLEWWNVEHEILASIVDHIPELRMDASSTVGDDAPVTLQFLIEDYIAHQMWHLKQITAE